MLGRGWNPGRVFPEVVMPFAAQFGIYFLYPLGISFTRAVSIGLGLCVIGFICIYLCTFEFVIKKVFDISEGMLAIVTSFFLACHFWILRSGATGNLHLLEGGDPNLYFCYVIPVLLNYSAVFVWGAIRKDIDYLNRIKKALFYFWVYFAVFFNLFASVLTC